MSKHVTRKRRTGATTAVVSAMLLSFITLTRSDGMFAGLSNAAMTAMVAMSGLIYVPIALIAYRSPALIARRETSIGAAVMACTGCALWMLLAPTLNPSNRVALLFAVDILINVGRAWATVLAVLSISHLGSQLRPISYVCAGVGLSYPLALALSSVSELFAVPICTVGILALLALGTNRQAELFEELRQNASQSELSVTDPFSFIPLSSRLFLCIFLFEATFGFATTPKVGGLDLATCLGVGGVLAIVAVCDSIGLGLLCISKTRELSEDSLFTLCVLFVLLGFLLISGTDELLSTSYLLLTVGAQLFYALTLCVLATAGRVSPVGSITCIATGLAVSTCASSVGGALNAQLHLGTDGGNEAIAMTAFFAFSVVSYALVAMRGYGFARLFDQVRPLTVLPAKTSDAAVCDERGPHPANNPADHDRSSSDTSESDTSAAELICFEHGLTPREMEITLMLARGRNGSFIQNALVISRNTAKTHIRHIYGKLDVHSQQELIDLFERVL